MNSIFPAAGYDLQGPLQIKQSYHPKIQANIYEVTIVLSFSPINFGVFISSLPQTTALKSKTGAKNLVLDEHEKIETRLLFSFRL